jgi:RimJ/RimL family protein N-acetyltransferase
MCAQAPAELGVDLSLSPFERCWADSVAHWVCSEAELRLLAPSSVSPLDSAKVLKWLKPGGMAYLGWVEQEPEPIAYGEVNPIRGRPDRYWLGHVILRPGFRGRGIGRRFVEALVTEAFDRHGAREIALIVFPENVAAVECYVAVGFRSAGEEYHRFRPHGPKERLLRLEITPDRIGHRGSGGRHCRQRERDELKRGR